MTEEERVEEYAQYSNKDLAWMLVDRENDVERLKANNKELAKLYMRTTREKDELDPSRLESALRMYIAELDYDKHKYIQSPEDGGPDQYPDEVDYFLRCWETAGEGN
ncbi:hypothetical protein [Streptomyces ardesiacus]|uniref:hypothetical protein n=1 Tax=Streptomyces ardesiacus TaxID=285564 RepID=UPI003666890F